MNTKPIELSTDPDLRGLAKAIQRAALKAREIAKNTVRLAPISRYNIIFNDCFSNDTII